MNNELPRAGVRRLRILFVCGLLFVSHVAFTADIFRFYAPPGGVAANAAFERDETVPVSLTIEHEGVAIPSWFVAVSAGGSGSFEPRELDQGGETMFYQLYGTLPPSSDVLKSPPEALAAGNVITSADFGTVAAITERVTFTFYLSVPAAQFVSSGEYTDTVAIELYTGDFAAPGSHTLVDTTSVSLTGRMAQTIDLYADREPGIRSLDLTALVSARLIATVYERSNSVTGYTVTVTSANLASDTSGASGPFFAHTTASEMLPYSLAYGGTAVSMWSGGAAVVVDSTGTTAPEWISRELRITYSGSPTLAAGDYEDRLVITISAK